jgi:hypothetical protein
MSAINKNGKAVNINDAVSIIGTVVSVSGSGSLATVVCQSPLDAGTYVITAHDAYAVQQEYDSTSPDALYPAVSIDGKHFGQPGDGLTVLGVCTAISGSGLNAILTVLLKTSQTSINTASGNVSSDNV